jgi:hypothetical protein
MSPIAPFWFKQRQLKAEAVSDNYYRVSGPNVREWFLGIRPGEDGRWAAFLRDAQDGPDVSATAPEFATTNDAWEAAFELYRQKVIV